MDHGSQMQPPVAGLVEKDHFEFSTDKSHRQKMHTQWSTGFFVAIKGKTTEFLVATEEGIHILVRCVSEVSWR